MKFIHKDVTLDKVMEMVERDDNEGFCVTCGYEHGGIEPDARRYKCENCESDSVYGAEELLMHLAI